MPVGNVFVGDPRCYVKHDDATLSWKERVSYFCGRIGTLNIISISQTSEFFLASSVPRIETNLTIVGMECDGMNFSLLASRVLTIKRRTFDAKSGDVFLLKFTSKMSLDKGGLYRNIVSCYFSRDERREGRGFGISPFRYHHHRRGRV